MGDISKMKVFILVSLVALSLAAIPRPESRDDKPEPVESYEEYGDMDPDDNMTEEEFEKAFDQEPVTDPKEKAKRAEALKEAEEEVKKENEKFEHGKAEYWEEIQEWSDLPKDEFEKTKTGDNDNKQHGRGLVEPKEAPVDEMSERYFAALLSRDQPDAVRQLRGLRLHGRHRDLLQEDRWRSLRRLQRAAVGGLRLRELRSQWLQWSRQLLLHQVRG